MRPRRWVLVVACCFCSLAIVLVLVKRSLERNRNLENLLIEAVSSSIKGTCSVEAVRIGLFSVHLRNVAVSLPLQAFTITIRDIKMGLSFSKLVNNRGDLTRSINQIILIRPRIDFSLPQPPSERQSRTPPSPPPLQPSVPSESPVNQLLVKEGIIRLLDRDGDTAVLAGELAGTLRNANDEIAFNLAGECGAAKRNLSLQGVLSWLKNDNHLSLRLTDALIEKKIALENIRITSGTISGAVECTFPNRLSPDSTELHGWIRLSNGAAVIGTQPRDAPSRSAHPRRLDSIMLGLSLENKTFHVNECGAVFRGIRFTASGDYIFGNSQYARFQATGKQVIIDSLYGLIPDDLRARFSGNGAAAVSFTWKQDDDPEFTLSANGIAVNGFSLDRLAAGGHISGTKLIADSATLKTPFLCTNLHGFFDLAAAKKNWDVEFAITSDSLPDSLGIEGGIRVLGTATASPGLQPQVDCRLSAEKLRYEHISLGNPQLVANLHDNRCTFSSIEIDSATAVVVYGTIDSVLSAAPHANCMITIRSDPIKEQLKRMHGMPLIDSAHLTVNGSGWLNSFNATLELALKVKEFSGTLKAQIVRLPSDTGALIWKMYSDDMSYRNVPIDFTGKGKVLDSLISIDTLSGYNGVRGRARIYHMAVPPRIDALLEYEKPISQLLCFLPEGAAGHHSGTINGRTIVSGTFDSLATRSNVKLQNIGNEEINGFSTELTITTLGKQFTVLPAVIRRDTNLVLTLDTISNPDGHISFHGSFDGLAPAALLGPILPPEMNIDGLLSGSLATSKEGFPISFTLSAPYIAMDTVRLDSIRCRGTLTDRGITVKHLDFRDGKRSTGRAAGYIPWAMLGQNATDLDTLHGSVYLEGDLLASIEKNITSPIGGTGKSTADIAFFTAGGNWRFTRGTISLPHGLLRVRPFVLDDVKNFTFLMTIDSNAVVHTDMSGTIKRKPIRIFSEHRIPDGYEPLMIGPLNFGMFQTVTPKKGVDLHLPGFMALKERGSIDFQGKQPFPNFTISGPLDKLKLTGTWLLRDIEFTFPFLPFKELDWKNDPFTYVTWEMDVRPGNRKAMYFWDMAGKRNRIMRFVEGYLDPSSLIKVRGRDLDKTFRIYGAIRSYKGAVYYGRVFDRNFDVGVEFNPQKPDKNAGWDNLPLLWGSAEAFADTSRKDRVKLTCMVTDPVTGSVSEKGRLANAPIPNISFHLSSDFDELPGESEREYYRQAGITFTSLEGAGSAVSDFGEQLFHRYLLQRWERRIARKLGLDVMNIETSIVSNYFSKLYGRQFDGLLNEDDYLALANVGVTVGRYFFRDFLLLKARGELVPIDMALTPEYSVGFEFEPSRYLTMDINYGFYMTETSVQHSPLLMMQLRLPITRLRNMLNF